MSERMTAKKLERYANQTSAYARFSPNGRPHIVCPLCGALVRLFDEVPRTERRLIAQLADSMKFREAIEGLMRAAGCGKLDAKAAVVHIRRGKSRCHKCAQVIPRGALLCSQCMSVNLDW